MVINNRAVKIVIGILIVAGLWLLAFPLLSGSKANVALPLVFMMFGAGFYALVPALAHKWGWVAWLYLPGSLMMALGLTFLINVLTGDWNAWAYAWLLLASGLGVGMSLAAWQMRLHQGFAIGGVITAVGGLALFAVFGAIVGGLFIQVMALLLLVLSGLALFRFKPRLQLLDPLLWRAQASATSDQLASSDQRQASLLNGSNETALPPHPMPPERAALTEPLSARELQVLGLIGQGLSNAQIAAHLTLAPRTVKTHINNIYGKLGVENRVQALKLARDLRLIDP